MRVQAKQRVYLKGTLNGKSVVFLVDSGAESNFVASSAVKRLGLHTVKAQTAKGLWLMAASQPMPQLTPKPRGPPLP
jgi:hypothetical protein